MRSLVLILAASTALAGCSLAPKYARTELPVPPVPVPVPVPVPPMAVLRAPLPPSE